MPIPDFVADLRRKVGRDHVLWMPGVTAVVFDAADRVLLIRRSDTGEWAPITGILDPGEEPAVGAVREVREEAGVRATVQRLVSVRSTPAVTHVNGDRAQYLDLAYRMPDAAGVRFVRRMRALPSSRHRFAPDISGLPDGRWREAGRGRAMHDCETAVPVRETTRHVA